MVPEDHKPKVIRKDGVATMTIRGITVSVADSALDDFELMEELSRIDDGQGHRFGAVARRLFGDGYKQVMDGLRDESGRVPVEPAIVFIRDVMSALNPN